MLLCLIYVSRSLEAMPLDLKEILAASQRNNPRRGITGAMCFLDSVYMQYLEGEEQAVDALYREIDEDPRHKETRLLDRRAIPERLFGQWSMGLMTWNENTKSIYRSFNPGRELDLYATNADNAGPFFRALAQSSNWAEVTAADASQD